MGSTKQHTGWLTLDNKYRSRGRGNGFFNYYNENSDGLSELNRGPRARITKNQKVPTRVTVTTKGQNDNLPDTVENNTLCAAPDREQYNPEEFPVTFTDAKFFVIKSYSEDDVHKSVKYNVNTSSQFVGVAEMVGPVDFNKSLDYWQQDKWVGYFPVKWHIVKDVPNNMLKHIILEYNENKPVTNSRDTHRGGCTI
ncbi:putative YTH domain-containing protein [Helianthus annuus]|nr:putative YTH domain-containing protein [Helianthus annuus]KAJ0851352.1 putative YTH domain-containing protein [Helianthus annuus]